MVKKAGVLTALAALTVFALVAVATAKDQKYTGNLIDAACATKTGGHMDKVKGHKKSCALMEPCKNSGYGIVTADGKFHKFDDNGNKLALDLLNSTKTENDIMVTVEGTMEGDTLKVTKLEEKVAKK
jgi:hypothetical protein